jgi:hypothetical protein
MARLERKVDLLGRVTVAMSMERKLPTKIRRNLWVLAVLLLLGLAGSITINALAQADQGSTTTLGQDVTFTQSELIRSKRPTCIYRGLSRVNKALRIELFELSGVRTKDGVRPPSWCNQFWVLRPRLLGRIVAGLHS